MADARLRENWNRQSQLMAWIGNVHGGKRGGRPFYAAELDPYRSAGHKDGLPLTAKALAGMKPLFGRVHKLKVSQVRVRKKK